MTEAEAWRVIGEAFEARAAHPELDVGPVKDLARRGLCVATHKLWVRGKITPRQLRAMDARTYEEINTYTIGKTYFSAYLLPGPWEGGTEPAEVRAMLAYLFAKEAADAN